MLAGEGQATDHPLLVKVKYSMMDHSPLEAIDEKSLQSESRISLLDAAVLCPYPPVPTYPISTERRAMDEASTMWDKPFSSVMEITPSDYSTPAAHSLPGLRPEVLSMTSQLPRHIDYHPPFHPPQKTYTSLACAFLNYLSHNPSLTQSIVDFGAANTKTSLIPSPTLHAAAACSDVPGSQDEECEPIFTPKTGSECTSIPMDIDQLPALVDIRLPGWLLRPTQTSTLAKLCSIVYPGQLMPTPTNEMERYLRLDANQLVDQNLSNFHMRMTYVNRVTQLRKLIIGPTCMTKLDLVIRLLRMIPSSIFLRHLELRVIVPVSKRSMPVPKESDLEALDQVLYALFARSKTMNPLRSVTIRLWGRWSGQRFDHPRWDLESRAERVSTKACERVMIKLMSFCASMGEVLRVSHEVF